MYSGLLCFFLCFFENQIDEHIDFVKGEEGERIGQWVHAFESTGFSGSVLAAKDGKVVAAIGAGYCDLEYCEPITPSSLFELASISKPITSICVLKLVEQAKIRLDCPISSYLDDVPANCRAITVRDLLQHTSGISPTNVEEGSIINTIKKIFSRGPEYTPGSRFEYWNQGYAVLSELISRCSGIDYTEFCRNELFDPAGMKSTCFTGDLLPNGAIVTVGKSIFGEPRSALDHPYGAYDLRYRGMGGVVSNVWDLWRLENVLHGKSMLTDVSKQMMFQPGKNDYALGWFVKQNKHGQLMQYHSGSVRGFSCVLIRYPESKGFITVLCNSSDAQPQEMARDIEDLLFSRKPNRELPPNPVDEKLRRLLAGVYRASSGAESKISIEGNVTRILIGGKHPNWPSMHGTLGLGNDGKLVLYEPNSISEFAVTMTASGTVESFVLDAIEFKRQNELKTK